MALLLITMAVPSLEHCDLNCVISQQLPNVPKKLEKFNNFVGNSFKIKDNAVSVLHINLCIIRASMSESHIDPAQ